MASRTYTRGEIRNQAQVLADDENARLASVGQYNIWIDAAHAWLIDLLVSSGIYPSVSDTTIVTTGVGSEALPDRVYSILTVHRKLDGGELVKLRPMHLEDRERYDIPDAPEALRYVFLSTGFLMLLPKPPVGQSYVVFHVSSVAKTTADTDLIDGVNGWEQLIVLDVAIKARLKEESSIRDLVAERDRVLARIERHKTNRLMDAQAVPVRRRSGLIDAATRRRHLLNI